MLLGFRVPKQKVVCRRCGVVRTDRTHKGAEPLCINCEAAKALESEYVWVGRCLVRRSEGKGMRKR